MMLYSLFSLIVGTLCDLLAIVFLVRFAMQWQRVPFRNPLGRFVQALTDWAVLPLRKVVPGLFGLDLASLLLAWLVQAIFMGVMIAVADTHAGSSVIGLALVLGLLETLRLAIYLAMGVVILSAILSWVNPYSPVAPLIDQLAAPLLRPFRRVIPLIGGVDLSPLAALLLLQVGLMLLGQTRASLLPLF